MNYKKYKPVKPPKPRYTNNLISQGKSKEELAVFNMIKLEFPHLKVYESDRVILHGRELDIWIPSMKLGVEFNGLFYHNSSTKSESYHLWKTVECDKQGVRLIQIFSDEWELKKYLVIDTIKKALGKFYEISSDDCICVGISQKEAKEFFETNDICGWKKADCYYGLLYKNELVTAVGLSIIDKGKLEIIEYSDKCKIHVSNGLNTIIEHIKISFADIQELTITFDRRVHHISDYSSINYEILDAIPPQTFYTKDFKSKKLLENFNNKTEAQLLNTGYVKVNDSGLLRIKVMLH